MTRHAAPPARRSSFGDPLPPSFYDRDTELVARDLLGRVLVHRTREGVAAGRIVETEAYLGPHDPACHAAAGLTPRTKALHGPPGTAYVYFIYGMHWCVNAVTREAGHGSAVLIRAIEPLVGLPLMRRRRGAVKARDLANGPGKVCQALGIDARRNGARLDTSPLRIVGAEPVPDGQVLVTPRIGISKAADWLLRYLVAPGA
ncbi:MAG: DNA-3-methyladenine glycosylase [Cytophagaceae bacterium]|nr:DNA-3-methyladenine glycosylase [Gemmatimonadaceae bacterium]